MDLNPPLPGRGRPRLEDADRVDVRGLVAAIFGRRMIIAAFAVSCAVLFYVIGGLMPPTYSAYAKVMLDPRSVRVMPSDEVVSNLNLSKPVILSEMSVMRSNILLGDLITQLGVERLETHYYGETRPAESLDGRIAALTVEIRRHLTVTREGESYVIVIEFDGREKPLVAEVANGIVDTYIAMQLDNRKQSAREATSWIREQMEQARSSVERAEAAVADYRMQSLAREGSSYETANQQLANLTGQLVVARSERVAAEAEYEQLKTILTEEGAQGLAKAVTSPLLESLAEDRLALSREDAEWARSFDADHPQRIRLQEEIARLDADLEAEATRVIDLNGNAVQVARLREESLAEGIVDLEGRLAGISENTLELRQREREAEAARQNYETLLNRLSAASGQDELQRSEARIIERAVIPAVPSAPRPKLMGAFGGMFGLTLAVAAALFLEMTRATFRSRGEVEAETGLRVLVSLPNVAGHTIKSIVGELARERNTAFSERVRQLRTFLFMRNGGFEKRVVMVTSSRPDEGKSLTAVALAEMAVLAGKSVILVDGDLRRSKLAETFDWKPEFDLADFIMERCDLAQAVHTDNELGINVLAAVKPCHEAAEDLSVDWLRPMTAELKRVYDVVIIDSPPLLKVADGLVLARVADSILYVVRWDATPRAAVLEGLNALSVMQLGVSGIILNGVDPNLVELAYGEDYAAHSEKPRAARS